MGGAALLALLIGAAAPGLTFEVLPDNRIRVTVVVSSQSLDAQTRAMIGLEREATRLCRGRGRAVSEGSLEVNQVPGRTGRVTISEIYTCTGSAEN